MALDAGVRSIEHGSMLEPETAARIAAEGAFMVPTLQTMESFIAHPDRMGLAPEKLAMLGGFAKKAYHSIEVARDAGVKLASGSDVVGPWQGRRGEELDVQGAACSAHTTPSSARPAPTPSSSGWQTRSAPSRRASVPTSCWSRVSPSMTSGSMAEPDNVSGRAAGRAPWSRTAEGRRRLEAAPRRRHTLAQRAPERQIAPHDGVQSGASERRLIRLFSQDDVADRQDPTLTSRYDLCPSRPGSGRSTRGSTLNANKPEYLSAEGLEKLKAELDELTNVKRPEVAQRIHDAKEYGDVTENAEYEDAKNEQAFVEGRIQSLTAIIKNAVIIDEKHSRTYVQIGSTVTIQGEANGKEKYTIVGAAEAAPDEGRISNESPVGRALLGKKKGEEVTVSVPAGDSTYTIVSIR